MTSEIKRLEKELAEIKKRDQESRKIAMLKGQIKQEQFKKTKLGRLAGATKTVFGGIGKGVGAFASNVSKPLTPEQQKAAERNRKKLNDLMRM